MSRPSLRDIDEWISWDQFLIELGLGLISPFMLPVTAFNAYHDWYYYHSGIYQEGDPPSRKFDADRARLHGASWTTGALGSYAYHSWMHPGKYPGLRTSSDVLKLVGHWAWESPTVGRVAMSAGRVTAPALVATAAVGTAVAVHDVAEGAVTAGQEKPAWIPLPIWSLFWS